MCVYFRAGKSVPVSQNMLYEVEPYEMDDNKPYVVFKFMYRPIGEHGHYIRQREFLVD